MEFSQIKHFLAVAEAANFTRASEACNISQPALSKSVQKLEQTLGGTLFDRSNNTVQLTEFGRVMRLHFERIEDNRRTAFQAARSMQHGEDQTLNFGIMCTISPHRLTGFLAELRRVHPEISVVLHDVVPEKLDELLLSGILDCVICAQSLARDNRFEQRGLFKENMQVGFSSSHPFSERTELSMRDLAGHPYLDRLHCEFRSEFIKRTRAEAIDLNVVFQSDREDWILGLLEQNSGICVVPESTIASATGLKGLPLEDLKATRQIELVYLPESSQNEPLKKLSALAIDFFGNS